MKKSLIATVLFAAVGFNASYAASEDPIQTETTTVAEDQFKAIEVEQLPQAIKDAVTKNYEGKTIKSAAVKDAEGTKTYKVTLLDAEEKTEDILFNEKGEVIPAE